MSVFACQQRLLLICVRAVDAAGVYVDGRAPAGRAGVRSRNETAAGFG